VLRFLREVSGPAVGLEAIRALFPDVPRCVLADLLRRYRYVWRWRYREQGFRLDWKRPGAVWAIDFSEPPQPIDGVFDQLFAVRDLAGHEQLAWTPVKGAAAEQAMAVMGGLFREHGAPLVVKCDNGSAFISDEFQAFLAERGVLLLYSPPRRPQYNGAVERSNGVLKTYTQQHAAAEQHPFRWTSDDVEAARQLANTLSRPWGYRGPTPNEAWQKRERIADEQRQAFQAAAERERGIARHDLDLPPMEKLSREDQARLDRLALQRALCALDYLEMHRADRPKKAKRLSRAELAKRAAETAGAKESAAPAPPDASPPPSDPAPIPRASFEGAAAKSSESRPDAAASEALAAPTAPQSRVESNNATVNTSPAAASPAAAQKNETSQLAPPMAADTMRARAEGEAGVRAGPSLSAPADVEPAKPPWPLRFIAPLLAGLKAAKIS
jgi:transposase InsO family protein